MVEQAAAGPGKVQQAAAGLGKVEQAPDSTGKVQQAAAGPSNVLDMCAYVCAHSAIFAKQLEYCTLNSQIKPPAKSFLGSDGCPMGLLKLDCRRCTSCARQEAVTGTGGNANSRLLA